MDELLFEYGVTKLEVGHYIIDVIQANRIPERYVAEYMNDSWLPTGSDYDPWQYGRGPMPVIKVLARIDTYLLAIEPINS